VEIPSAARSRDRHPDARPRASGLHWMPSVSATSVVTISSRTCARRGSPWFYLLHRAMVGTRLPLGESLNFAASGSMKAARRAARPDVSHRRGTSGGPQQQQVKTLFSATLFLATCLPAAWRSPPVPAARRKEALHLVAAVARRSSPALGLPASAITLRCSSWPRDDRLGDDALAPSSSASRPPIARRRAVDLHRVDRPGP